MDVNEINLEELEHEHPLTLVDLQLMHRDYLEDDDEYADEDLIKTQNFKCMCNQCDRQIDWYHRYYYTCDMPSCNYSLHKFCKEIPKILQFQGHPSHTLTLRRTLNDDKCRTCLKCHRDGIGYHCSTCNYGIDLLCATFMEQNTIHHPAHPHPLISFSVEPGLNKCFACKKKHEGHFYQCITCLNFLVNSDCLTLPIKLSLETQQFSHRHLLTLSYSFLDQLYDFECRICGMELEDEHLIYKCSKCMYYVHPDCATQRIEPFMSVFLPGLGNTQKNFKDVDHPNLLHLPADDESHILAHQISEKIFEGETWEQKRDKNVNLTHYRIDHPLLVLINNATTTTRVSLHDPMKRIKLLCNACAKPITKMPFYKCFEDDDYVLHEWCAQLPTILRNVLGHGGRHGHKFKLWNRDIFFLGIKCSICRLPCNGALYYYIDSKGVYFIDAHCAFMPREITHEAHADHLLTRVDGASSSHSGGVSKMECRACRVGIIESDTYFRCNACDFYLDCRCALHLPKTVRNKYDKHSLKLSYSPIEDHKGQYFCEVCEEDLDPGKWFYHCVECAQSIHSACAPLILQSEQGINSLSLEGVYKYINFKFTGKPIRSLHQHPVSVAPGTKNDGLCQLCGSELQSHLILKCLDCSFACHAYDVPSFEDLSRLFTMYKYEEKKRMKKQHGPQTNLEFYPSEMKRPETRDWKVIDDPFFQ
ncbi:putative chromatin regulator PHD family [Helianthus debilis subsp. tardiflorus]